MINDKNQKIVSGEKSTNLQVGVVNMNNGLQYSEVKEIATDIFKSNFLILKDEAITIAVERSNKFTQNLIEELEKRKIDSLNGINDPGFQYSLFEAQKNYAKTGDNDMEGTLIDILVDRLNYSERSLKQIVLDESIQIISKLTNIQLNTLTIIFLLKYTQNHNVLDFNVLKWYLNTYIKPFTDNLSKELSLYQHLEYTGCGSISMGEISIEGIFKETYRGLFFGGFETTSFKESYPDIFEHKDLIMKCLNDDNNTQLNAQNKDAWLKKIKTKGFDSNRENEVISLFESNILPNDKIKTKLIELGGSEIENLFDIWNNSDIKSINLTA